MIGRVAERMKSKMESANTSPAPEVTRVEGNKKTTNGRTKNETV